MMAPSVPHLVPQASTASEGAPIPVAHSQSHSQLETNETHNVSQPQSQGQRHSQTEASPSSSLFFNSDTGQDLAADTTGHAASSHSQSPRPSIVAPQARLSRTSQSQSPPSPSSAPSSAPSPRRNRSPLHSQHRAHIRPQRHRKNPLFVSRRFFRRIWKRLSDRLKPASKPAAVKSRLNTAEMPSSKNSNGTGGQVSHRLRNFFRMNTGGSTGSGSSDKEKDKTPAATTPDAASGSKSRHTKFFSNTVGRLRAHTVASEGNQLDEAMSPTAHANPYFAHQGQPGLRHHNADSVPPSPPDTPTLKVEGPDGTNVDQATSETKEELARRLRRVASAPNAQGLFSKGASNGERPATAELGKDPLLANASSGSLGLMETTKAQEAEAKAKAAEEDVLAALPAPNTAMAFRRTYSSNSIKVRNVEVSPSSFDKIKLIGKGDVGKVYLVREKKSSRLYAMKSMPQMFYKPQPSLTRHSTEQEGDD